MWFSFGFISLFLFSIYFLFKRFEKNWEAYTHNFHGRNYIQGSRIFENGSYIGCEGKSDLNIDLSIKKENFIDKLFKFLGVSVECQINNVEFDNKFYLVTDNKNICNYLRNNKNLQEELSKLLEICEENSLKFNGFYLKGNRLWVHILKNKEESISKLIPILFNIMDIFNNDLEEIKKTIIKTESTFKISIFLSISSAIVITATCLFIYTTYSFKIYEVNVWDLIKLSFIPATTILLILMFSVIKVLGKSSRTHLVLIEFLILGYVGLIMISYEILKEININFDTSLPRAFVTKIINKEINHSRKGPTTYYLYLSEWENSKIKKKIKISSSIYKKYENNDIVKIYIKKGKLNVEWILEIQKASSEEFLKFVNEKIIREIKNSKKIYVPKLDEEEIKEKNKMDAKLKILDDLYQKGMIYFKNNDYPNALSYFEKAASQEDAKSAQMIGIMYLQGKGVENNQDKALIYFKRANEISNKINLLKSIK